VVVDVSGRSVRAGYTVTKPALHVSAIVQLAASAATGPPVMLDASTSMVPVV
jgi:hypothetical protein